MHLRLVHFEGIRISLPPGWYELPSHIESTEVDRLLDLLSRLLPGVEDVVECTWAELDALAPSPSTIAFVRVPTQLAEKQLRDRFARLTVHHGFFQRDEPGHWPEDTWDEREIKRVLVAALRKAVKRPEHPLAQIGIAKLPVERLAEATSEPIELLILAESTVEWALRQRAEQQAIDWDHCVRWSIGRRLANRLHKAERGRAAALRDVIAKSPGGSVSTVIWDREVDALVRLGLAQREQGDAMLAPLARLANEQGIVGLLEVEGATMPAPEPLVRERATNRAAAADAFDPRHELFAGDPWLVDPRAFVPALLEFGRHVIQQLGRRDRFVRMAVLQLPGSGGTTLLRRIAADLEVQGVQSIRVRLPSYGRVGVLDLLLRSLGALLQQFETLPRDELPTQTLAELRAWLGEHGLDGELRDYIRLGREIMEEARIASLLAILQRVATEGTTQDQIRAGLEARLDDLVGYLRRVLDDLRVALGTRGRSFCLHFEGTERLDATPIADIFLAHAEDLERLACHFVFSIDPMLEHTPGLAAAYDLVTLPNLAAEPEAFGKVVHAVLDARAALDSVFEAPEVEATIVAHAHGSLRLGLELARRAATGPLEAGECETVVREHHASGVRLLPDEWLAIQGELERRERIGEDVGAWRKSLASPLSVGPVLHPFDVLERYRLLEELPSLPDALMWRAWDRHAGGVQTLAVLRTDRVADKAWMDCLHARMQALQAFEHPHVARMLGESFEIGGHRIHAVYRPEGVTLAQKLSVESLPALAGIGEAIDALHAGGLVHGEITPDDIVIDTKGKAVLTGIELPAHAGSAYAAPKQFSEAAADFYGLGASVLACLQGKAIEGAIDVTSMDRIECSEDLRKALRHALAQSVEARADNCAKLAECLRSTNIPRTAGSPEPGPKPRSALWRLASRLRRVVPSWETAALVGVGTLLIGTCTINASNEYRWFMRPPTGTALGVARIELEGTPDPLHLVGLSGGSFTQIAGRFHRRRVEIPAFEICETEVSQAQYDAIRFGKNCVASCEHEPVREQATCAERCWLPVVKSDWYGALVFMNGLTHWHNSRHKDRLTECYNLETSAWDRACTGYRLPTEAEWEYAALAGTTTTWSFGDDVNEICIYGNVDDDDPGHACKDGFEGFAPVETPRLAPNPWGLHGMHGNVWEWVFDTYADYDTEDVFAPVRDDIMRDKRRVVRGGSHLEGAEGVVAWYRSHDPPSESFYSRGFRCARGPLP